MVNEHPYKVVIYGDSLILEGVRTHLEVCDDIKVFSLNLPCTSPSKEIMAQCPAALIFDTTACPSDFPVFLLLQPNLLLIGIDPETHQALVWSSRRVTAIEAADLLNIIRQDNPKLLGKVKLNLFGREESKNKMNVGLHTKSGACSFLGRPP